MNLEYETSLKDAYVLDDTGLRQLWQFMNLKAGEVTAQARCSDGVRRSWKTWDEFSQFNNSGNARINKLAMRAGDRWGNDPWLSVDWTGIDGTEVEINFNEAELAAARDELHGIICGMRHGILSRARRQWIPGCAVLAALAVIALPIVGYAYIRSSAQDPLKGTDLMWPILFVAFWVMAVASPLFYVGLLDYTLPKVHFAIGQGERRYKNWAKLWAGIGVMLVALVGTIASLVAIAL